MVDSKENYKFGLRVKELTQTFSYVKVKKIGRRMSSWVDAASMSTCSQESTSCVLSISFNGTTKLLWVWFTNSNGIQLNCHPLRMFVPESSPQLFFFFLTFVVVCLWPTNAKSVWMKVKVSISPFFFSLIVKCNCTCYSLKDNHRLYWFCIVFVLFFLLPNEGQKNCSFGFEFLFCLYLNS